MKESALKYFGQLFLIVFSVVLGLYLSERIEERKNDKNAANLLSKVESELEENRKILKVWVPYHREILTRLDSMSKEPAFMKAFIADRTAIYMAFSRGTIMGDMPSNDAWDIAKSHPLIVNIDYDKLLSLSKVYNQQKITYESIPGLIELMLSTDLNSKSTAAANVELFTNKLHEVYGREMLLLQYYAEAEEL